MKIPFGNPSQRSSASSALLGGLPELLKQGEFAVYVRERLRSTGKFVGWVDKGGVLWLDAVSYPYKRVLEDSSYPLYYWLVT
jgi:hypothetical protein